MPDDPNKKKKDRKQQSNQPHEKRYEPKRKTPATKIKPRK
jgi:hypothetical protein